MIEIEVKLKINDRAELISKLVERGFKRSQNLKETDVYFNGIDRDLRDTDEALRIRITESLDGSCLIADGSPDDKLITLTYKGPKLDKVSMTRKELSVIVDDFDAMKEVLTELRYRPVSPVVKKRIEYFSETMTACVDNVEGLGDYLELEIIADSEDDREKSLKLIEEELISLGYSMDDTTTTSYLSMLEKLR